MNKIPKIIHYCWFGPKPIPELELKCMKTWTEFLPDYEFMFWNEETFDINNSCNYVKQAYESRHYPFVADYVRLYALVEFGGIYLDTDIQLLTTLDKFLYNDAFTGFENKTRVAAGIMGCKKGNMVFKKMLDHYNTTEFIDSNNLIDISTICNIMMNIIEKEGFIYKNMDQQLENIRIYERDIFYPKKLSDDKFRTTERSVSIHHYVGSWLTPNEKKRGENLFWRKICRPILRKIRKLISSVLGERKSKTIEKKFRNYLR